MHFVIFSIVSIVLIICVWHSESNRNCYNAKTCMHSAIERCGVEENGELRLFLDMCDIHEFNCIQNTSFKVTARNRCIKLEGLNNNNNNNDNDNNDLRNNKYKPLPLRFFSNKNKNVNIEMQDAITK